MLLSPLLQGHVGRGGIGAGHLGGEAASHIRGVQHGCPVFTSLPPTSGGPFLKGVKGKPPEVLSGKCQGINREFRLVCFVVILRV